MLSEFTLSAFIGFDPNSWVMYLLYALIVGFVSVEAIYYLVRSWRRAKKIGMDMGKMKKVVTTSITFSILPAIGIGLGVVTLVGALGIAFPSIRLSVIGALQYETQMADGAATAITGSDNGLSQLIANGVTKDDFLTMATIMTVGIIWGPLLVTLFYKKLQPVISKIGGMNVGGKDGEMLDERKKVNVGDLIFTVTFIGMVLGYLAMAISTICGSTTLDDGTKFLNGNTIYGYYNFIAVIVAAICMYVFELLIHKAHIKWLDSFSTSLSMLIAMAVVAVISYFAQQNGWDPTLSVAAPSAIAAIVF